MQHNNVEMEEELPTYNWEYIEAEQRQSVMQIRRKDVTVKLRE